MPVAVAVSVDVGYSSVFTEDVEEEAAAEVEVSEAQEPVTVTDTVSVTVTVSLATAKGSTQSSAVHFDKPGILKARREMTTRMTGGQKHSEIRRNNPPLIYLVTGQACEEPFESSIPAD